VAFPLYACRDTSTATIAAATRTPAFDLLSNRRRGRPPLLPQAESKVAAHLPFEQAQADLHFFTHPAVNVATYTIARHACAVDSALDKDGLDKPLDALKDLLSTRATRDRVAVLQSPCHLGRIQNVSV